MKRELLLGSETPSEIPFNLGRLAVSLHEVRSWSSVKCSLSGDKRSIKRWNETDSHARRDIMYEVEVLLPPRLGDRY
jgi:hypothetical protein